MTKKKAAKPESARSHSKAAPKAKRVRRIGPQNVAGEKLRVPKAAQKKEYPLIVIAPVPEPTPGERFQTWRARSEAMGELCEYIVGGGHLFGFSREQGFPYATVRFWIDSDDVRIAMYARAREDRADTMADEIQQIADEDVTTPIVIKGQEVGRASDPGKVADKKVRIDARKWLAAKMKPRTFGDKLEVEGSLTIPPQQLTDAALVAQLAALGVVLPALPGPDIQHQVAQAVRSVH